jgi:outer membrane receptor protein involved in Fe transport
MLRRPLRPHARACSRLSAGCVVLLLLTLLVPAVRANNSLFNDDLKTCDVTLDVVDQDGAAVADARVTLLDAANVELRRAATDGQGRFTFKGIAAASYIVAVNKGGFRETRRVLRVAGQNLSVKLGLDIGELNESVTVTPSRGAAQEVFETPEAVSVTTAADIARRAHLLLPQALKETPGVHLQQTTTSQGSLFIRGLTGQQILHLVEGVRFNNSTFRPGANQYLALIDPSFAERVELVRGPNSAQYGSDSLGGTINVLTRPTGIGASKFELHGKLDTFFASADLSAGAGVHVAGGGARWGFMLGGSGFRAQDLRTGGGVDSHSVVTRLFGISSKALGSRLQDTGFAQYGAHAKLVTRPTDSDTFSFEYMRGAQLGVRRYDQLDGGLGNLLNRFDPQTLDFAVARYSRAGLLFLDSLSVAVSYNGQRDDRTSQSINNSTGLRSRVTEEFNRTNVFGYQAQATMHAGRRHALSFGGEFYDEFIRSERRELRFNNTTLDFTDTADVRARFPDGSRYRTLGLFVQDIVRLTPQRLTGSFGLRYSRFSFRQSSGDNPKDARGQPTVPDFATAFGDITFNTGLVFSLNQHLNFTANVSRGFRAPNVNDFGSIGVSGIGFEITPEEGARLNGLVGRIDPNRPEQGDSARPVRQLRAETLYNYEAGLKLRTRRVEGTLSVFDTELTNFIERRVLLLPQGAVGAVVGGQQVARQDATGAVYTSLSGAPVFVRANAAHIRMSGIEGAALLRLTRSLELDTRAFYVRGTETATGAPPALENGIPPLNGFVGLRWQPSGARFWIEGYSSLAGAQTRLSDNDLQQARIGGIRTRDEITNFFNNGAVARGLVREGVLLSTGERLPQVLRRVLGSDLSARVPLFTKHPGYATLNVRGGFRIGEASSVTAILENIFDRNYRTMGSGIDAPGVNVMIRYSHSF